MPPPIDALTLPDLRARWTSHAALAALQPLSRAGALIAGCADLDQSLRNYIYHNKLDIPRNAGLKPRIDAVFKNQPPLHKLLDEARDRRNGFVDYALVATLDEAVRLVCALAEADYWLHDFAWNRQDFDADAIIAAAPPYIYRASQNYTFEEAVERANDIANSDDPIKRCTAIALASAVLDLVLEAFVPHMAAAILAESTLNGNDGVHDEDDGATGPQRGVDERGKIQRWRRIDIAIDKGWITESAFLRQQEVIARARNQSAHHNDPPKPTDASSYVSAMIAAASELRAKAETLLADMSQAQTQELREAARALHAALDACAIRDSRATGQSHPWDPEWNLIAKLEIAEQRRWSPLSGTCRPAAVSYNAWKYPSFPPPLGNRTSHESFDVIVQHFQTLAAAVGRFQPKSEHKTASPIATPDLRVTASVGNAREVGPIHQDAAFPPPPTHGRQTSFLTWMVIAAAVVCGLGMIFAILEATSVGSREPTITARVRVRTVATTANAWGVGEYPTLQVTLVSSTGTKVIDCSTATSDHACQVEHTIQTLNLGSEIRVSAKEPSCYAYKCTAFDRTFQFKKHRSPIVEVIEEGRYRTTVSIDFGADGQLPTTTTADNSALLSTPPPERSLTRLAVTARASSNSIENPPQRAFDDDIETAWCTALRRGQGEWIEATIPDGAIAKEVSVSGGWPYDSPRAHRDMWEICNIASELEVSWDGGSQRVSFDRATDRNRRKTVAIPASTKHVRVTVRSVNSNRGIDIVCLGEIGIRGEFR